MLSEWMKTKTDHCIMTVLDMLLLVSKWILVFGSCLFITAPPKELLVLQSEEIFSKIIDFSFLRCNYILIHTLVTLFFLWRLLEISFFLSFFCKSFPNLCYFLPYNYHIRAYRMPVFYKNMRFQGGVMLKLRTSPKISQTSSKPIHCDRLRQIWGFRKCYFRN